MRFVCYANVGGFSKLIKNSGSTGSSISYANRMYSTGNQDEQTELGFIRHTIPCFLY